MKIKKIVQVLFIISVFIWNGWGNVLAMDTGFSTENMTPDDQQIFLSNVNLSLITEEPKKSPIVCFDINEYGLIILGFKDGIRKTVSVYEADGTFMYGYTFNCNGDFGIEWDNNNIIIYFVRSDVAMLLDSTGIPLELKKIKNTIDNNSYWNHSVYATKRTVNESQYIIRNKGILNIFSSSYSQLIKMDAEGTITTIYDISSTYTLKFIIIFIAVILFIGLSVIILVREFIKLKK